MLDAGVKPAVLKLLEADGILGVAAFVTAKVVVSPIEKIISVV